MTNPGDRPAPQAFDNSSGWYFAKTTAQTTGQTLTCSIYRAGQQEAATDTDQEVYCAMLDSSAVVASGVWLIVKQTGRSWEGLINVYYPEPS